MSNAILPRSKFIHIPKCGGTAVMSTLWRIGLIKDHSQVMSSPNFGHLFASQMHNDLRINFAFVRNPITWWQSWYYWNKSQPLSRFNGEELKTKTFDEWIRDYGQLWLGMYSRIIPRYLGEDVNFPTNNKVTFIGKTEHLYKDLERILDSIGEVYDKDKLYSIRDNAYKLARSMTNAQEYNRNEISQESINIIYQTEKDIFKKFGYGKTVN